MKRLLACALVCAAGAAASAQTMYTVRESDDVLVRIDISDPNNPVFSDVGPLGTVFSFGGLTFGPGDELFMVGGRGNENLYRVDIGTGAASLIGAHNVQDLFGVAWDTSTSTMYAVQFIGNTPLHVLDVNTGAASPATPPMSRRLGGLTYNFDTDQLIGTEDGAGDLYEIDRVSGAQTLLFDGPFSNNSGLAYDSVNNYLWGIDWSGNMFYYDIGAGYARTDVRTGLGAHDGLAILPQDTGCPADLDGDGDADVNDFFLYLDLFEAGDPRADITGDGSVDVNDFFAYLDLFEQGC